MVYEYRIKHANDNGPGAQPEPLANLVAGDKLDCSRCIVDYLVKMWARSQAQSRGLKLNVAECAGPRFVTNLDAKPYPSHVKELYNGAIAACNK
jgi:hypothetical protein